MAMTTGQASVGTALVQIAGPFGASATIHLHLHDNTENVFIGCTLRYRFQRNSHDFLAGGVQLNALFHNRQR